MKTFIFFSIRNLIFIGLHIGKWRIRVLASSVQVYIYTFSTKKRETSLLLQKIAVKQ